MTEISKMLKSNSAPLVAITLIAIVLIVISFLSYEKIGHQEFEIGVWLGSIIVSGAAVIILLYHTIQRKKPDQFTKLPVYQFILLTTLLGCMIIALTFWPDMIFDGTPLSKEIRIDNATKTGIETTNYYFVIGGNGKDKALLEIPYYVIIPGILGAYIRYLYKEIRLYRNQFKKHLEKFTGGYLAHKNKILEICLAIGYSRDEIEKFTRERDGGSESNIPKNGGYFVRAGDILEFFKHKHSEIYSLPPEAAFVFSKYIKRQFCKLSNLEDQYDSLNSEIRDKAIYKTIYVIGIFFLAPLLAIISWLLLGLGDTEKFEAYVVMAFGAGLTADTIVKKIWSLAGDKLPENPDDELDDDTNKTKEKKPKPDAKKPAEDNQI